jgi:hypothetical protein
MDLTIDSVSMHLPPGFEARAAHIARLVMDAVGHADIQQSLALERLRLPAVQVSPMATDREVAASIVAAIVGELRATGERT